MNILKNRYFILGNIVLILITLPLVLLFIKKRTTTRSGAEASTVLSFNPPTTTPQVGQNFDLEVMVNPGKNLVSIVDMDIRFDPTKLEFVIINTNRDAFPQVLKGPIVSGGSIVMSVNIGSEVTKAVQTPTKVATITFKPLSGTTGTTQVSFARDTTDPLKPTRVLSLAEPDGAGENVLQSATPITLTIGGSAAGTTPTVTATPTPTSIVPTTTSGAGAGGPAAQNQAPVCTSLSVDRDTTGSAPFSLVFTANGRDTDGTVSKATFDFGDGPVQGVTQADGIGTNTVSVQAAHTFNNSGTFKASVSLTDNNGAISSSSAECSKTITVNAAPTAPAGVGGGGQVPPAATPIPKLPPTGQTTTTIGVIGGVLLMLAGGALLLIL